MKVKIFSMNNGMYKFLARIAGTLAALGLLCLMNVTYAAAAPAAGGIANGPYLMNPTPGGITVCWVSDTETTGSVDYRPVMEDARSGVKTANETKTTRFHRIALTGLKPYTLYTYTITCDAQTNAGTFRTAAPANVPFHFVAYGDNRTQPDKHAAVLAAMMQFRPDFVIQTGDQVASGDNLKQWDEFFTVASPMLRNTAYFPSLGNHEKEAAPYFQFFGVPREYSFDYGNVHFVALDSNRPEAEFADQENWLRKDLLAHQSATWRIVYLHHTPVTCVTLVGRREAAEKLRARLEPIFHEGKVQMVIAGHDHNYQHHFAGGIHYVVTGGGGAPLYDVKMDTPFVKIARKTHNYCEVTVNGTSLFLRAVQPDGTEIEKINLTTTKP